jgi:hypothetical protein
VDPNEALSEISRAMSTLSVAWDIVKRHPNHPRYADLLEDLIEKSGEIKENAEALLEWDQHRGFRPEPVGR